MFEDVWPKETEISVFHCQQCAEKALKAFLVFNNIEPPKIHDLIKLLKLCKNIDGGFSQLETYSKRLDPFSSASRYPNELAVNDPIVKTAIDDAQRVYDFCAAKIPV
jgi:HEPN domain-containing protein